MSCSSRKSFWSVSSLSSPRPVRTRLPRHARPVRRLARLGGPGGASFEEGLTARTLQGLSARRYAWADLLRRVFAVEVLECPRGGGPMRILAVIYPP